MKKIKYIFILVLGVFTFNSCETTELDLLDNPNALVPNQADIDLFMNSIQANVASFTQSMGNFGAELTRIENMRGRIYVNAYGPTSFDGVWETAYRNILKDILEMNIIAEEIGGYDKHIAISKIIEAHILITLVDYFGDIPYSEALDIENFNPKIDDGQSVYEAAETLLNEAIATLQTDAGFDLENDLYFDNDNSAWIKTANTLKLKIYIQTRLVDGSAISKFESIINSGNYISSNDESWVFNWGTNLNNPNSRHPLYNGTYGPGGVQNNGIYMANWFLDLMRNDKPQVDPRMQFYFYRQTDDVGANAGQGNTNLQCLNAIPPAHYEAIGAVFCVIEGDNGYWGRDHGDEAGIPPDNQLRTVYGLYPAGGRFDDLSFEAIDEVDYGALGGGFTPIILASTVDFWRAEASLFGGSGSSTTHVSNGVSKSFTMVRGFVDRLAEADVDNIPPVSDDGFYITEVENRMNDATSTEEKLDVLAKEYFITLFGNGNDAYTFYRRTGAPRDIQPNLESNPGNFIRSLWYPASEVSNNSSVNQKPNVSVRVFWDNNPETGFPINN